MDSVDEPIKRLEDRDWFVRCQAAEALGNKGNTRAVEPLIAALEDKDWVVRFRAVEALGKIGDARGVGPLIGELAQMHMLKDTFGKVETRN